MTTAHPRDDEWLRLLDGELTENRAAALRAHAAACGPCERELRDAEALLAGVAARTPGIGPPAAVTLLMSRLDDVPTRPPPRRWRPGLFVAGLASAAAVLVAVVPGVWSPAAPERFQPRGEAGAWSSQLGVELWALEQPLRRLGPGAAVAAGGAVVATYRNAGDEPAWLLVFALDAANEPGWIYPAFLAAGADPAAVRLEPRTPKQALPDAAVLVGLPPGPLRLVTVLSRAPLHVSDVERLAPAEREPAALRARWPDARVEALPVRLEPAAGARGGP